MIRLALPALLLLAAPFLAACVEGHGYDPRPVVDVPDDPAFETATLEETGFARLRRDISAPGDAAVLAQFDDADPATPAGYRDLIALNEALYDGHMEIEVIAEVAGTGPSETVTRILRLTADQKPFTAAAATGTYYLRGANYAWVTIDGGPVLSGGDARGLVDLVLDFDTGSAAMTLRTGVAGASEVRTEIAAADLPFDVRTGAFGGAVTVTVHDPDSALIYAIDGSLRGNLGGSGSYVDGRHDLTTSGLYTATGRDQGAVVSVDGVFLGLDPNALP